MRDVCFLWTSTIITAANIHEIDWGHLADSGLTEEALRMASGPTAFWYISDRALNCRSKDQESLFQIRWKPQLGLVNGRRLEP